MGWQQVWLEVEEAWWLGWQAYGGFEIVVVVGTRRKDRWV
jgi:hypothetical protein